MVFVVEAGDKSAASTCGRGAAAAAACDDDTAATTTAGADADAGIEGAEGAAGVVCATLRCGCLEGVVGAEGAEGGTECGAEGGMESTGPGS
mmetsp:Transcript_94585/g.271286  ORF Transcript_94585/g.271286 Transcript_94585/m.271286 type:complete len:92 (+) Transcript_94585:1081-1356(+)